MRTRWTRLRADVDTRRLHFCLRIAATAWLALILAWLFGLEHPQWAAMTVWIIGQPTRGQLLEKAVSRLLGTLAGALVGAWFLIHAGATPMLLVLGLALWVGSCAAAGNVLRGNIAYAAILAGYTGAMIALLPFDNPGTVLPLALDRMAVICTGIGVSILVNWLFLPYADTPQLEQQLRDLGARVLRHVRDQLDAKDNARRQDERLRILSALAAVEDKLDMHAAGSLRGRRLARQARKLLSGLLKAMLEVETLHSPATNERSNLHAVEDLNAWAEALEKGYIPSNLDGATQTGGFRQVPLNESRRLLEALVAAIAEYLRGTAQVPAPATSAGASPLILHRDWVGARNAMLRASGALLLVGSVWVGTGWSYGPFLLLGTSVMLTLFSTFDNPAWMMRYVFAGGVAGALASVICQALLWPLLPGLGVAIALTLPFILVGAALLSHRRTALAGMDYNMVFLLLLHPAWPVHTTASQLLSMGAAITVAPLIALVGYHFAFPVNAQRRTRLLANAVVREVTRLARHAPAPRRHARWRARHHHQLLCQMRSVEKSGEHAALHGTFAAYELGDAIVRMHGLLADPTLSPGTARALRTALRGMSRMAHDPNRIAATLQRIAHRLHRIEHEASTFVERASLALSGHPGFFARRQGG